MFSTRLIQHPRMLHRDPAELFVVEWDFVNSSKFLDARTRICFLLPFCLDAIL
eukprot:UN18063